MSILENLNIEQKKAANNVAGPQLILAGAGSGKTRTVTYRIAHMVLERGISPYKILAVTFTNKAAREMKERVEGLIGEEAKKVMVSTFHSFGVRLLRMYGSTLGYDSNFNIYDTDDQKKLVNTIMKDIGITDKKTTPARVVSAISKLKEDGITPEEYANDSRGFLESYKTVSAVYPKYNKTLKANNAMDFSDILVNTNAILDNLDILEKIQERYQYVMVDEYQDTNKIQYEIVNKIAVRYKNLCVVGDEDQSIYGFRGANIKNILDFEKDYPGAHVVKLEQNYRSTEAILEAANHVIKNNESSRGKNLWTDNEKGDAISIIEAGDGRDEAYLILQEINKLKNKGHNYKDLAILYRANSQSRAFEELFIKFNIPYKVFGGMQFYQRMEIKDIIAYMNVINNPKDSLSLIRILNVPKRKIGPKTIEKLREYADSNETTLFEALSHTDKVKLSPNMRIVIDTFYREMTSIMEEAEYMPVSEIFDDILKTFKYKTYIKEQNEDEDTTASRIENIEEFRNAISEEEKINPELTLGEYLERLSLISATDDLSDSDYVKLMTIHNSKGLEFPVVFIAGMEDQVFPSERADFDSGQLEEERRLCYVAITRAEKQLFIAYAGERFVYGTTQYRSKSRFINEIPPHLLNYLTPKKKDSSKEKSNSRLGRSSSRIENFNPLKSSSNPDLKYKPNDRVVHKKFGLGIVRDINDKTTEVEFTIGRKKFLTQVIDKFIQKA